MHKRHVASAHGGRGEMAAFKNAPSDLWTPAYDRFGIFCWRNKVTRELRYSDTPPRQPPALHPPAYVGDSYYPHLSTGRPFQHAARPPADRFPSRELGKKVQFHTPALKAPEPSAAARWTKGSAPAVMEPRSPPSVSPNNVARPALSAGARTPPSPKKSENEANHWFLQRNGKGEEYYLNTSTWKWQIETPDCLKKYTTRR